MHSRHRIFSSSHDIIPPAKKFCSRENHGATRSRHKTANEADNIAHPRHTIAAYKRRRLRISKNMIDLYRGCALFASARLGQASGDGSRRRLRISNRIVLCILSVMLAAGARNAAAAPLDDAAEHYRPYMIEGIGQALTGARNLRERIAAKDLKSSRRASFPSSTRKSTPGPMPIAVSMPSRRSCSVPIAPTSRARPTRWSIIWTTFMASFATCRSRRRG
jgi:hypothetical protein